MEKLQLAAPRWYIINQYIIVVVSVWNGAKVWVYYGVLFSKIFPQIIHVSRIFHEINHPAIGVLPFVETPILVDAQIQQGTFL